MASSSSWFPSGQRFDPKDDELLVHLFNFIAGDPFSSQGIIPIVDLYGDQEPWDISALHSCASQKKDMYFYTRLKKKANQNGGKKRNQNGGKSRISRLIGQGVWHGQDSEKKISYKGKGLFGNKKSMIYWNKKNPIQDRQWLLKEYSLEDSVLVRMGKENLCVLERKDFVLCRMRQNKRPKNNSGSSHIVGGDLSELFRRFKDIHNLKKTSSIEPSCIEEVINEKPLEEIGCGSLFLPQIINEQPLLQDSDSVNGQFSPPSPDEPLQEDMLVPTTPDPDRLFQPLGVQLPLTPDSDPLDAQLLDMIERDDSFLDILGMEFNADGEDCFWESYTEQVLAK